MATVGYPHPTFNIQNASSNTTTADVQLDGLFAPLSLVFAAKGTPNKIIYSGTSSLTDQLGSTTFDETSEFYNHQTRFLEYAAGKQGVYVVRLIDPAARTANLVLECVVSDVQITQYKTDALGNRITDRSGLPEPQLDAHGKSVTQAGIKVLWRTRHLGESEDPTGLKTSTITLSDSKTHATVYPILAVQGTSPGSLMNNWGFKLYRPSTIDTTVETNINSVLYRLAPYFLDPEYDTTASPISDVMSNIYNDISLKPAAVDPSTSMNYALKSIIKNQYYDNNRNTLLDITFTPYSANVKAIGDAVLAVSPELNDNVKDGYGVNILTGTDSNGNPYWHLEVDPASNTVASPDAILYLAGGTDGDTSDKMYEQLVQQYTVTAKTSDFRNIGRYPFTHIVDSGYTMDTKYALMSLLPLRNNLRILLSTQDVSQAPNTEAQDISAAQALMARAGLYPQSTTTNVPVMRVDIYYHCGELAANTAYSGVVPLTYARLATLCQYDGGTYITDDPGGFPGSVVTLFDTDTINWVPNSEDEMSAAWLNGGNYVQYASRNVIFFPSLRTVFAYDTSLLSDSVFTDRIMYMCKILWLVWATYSGVRRPPKKLFSKIEKDATDRCNKAIGQGITVNITLVQTAYDQQLGYATDAIIQVLGDEPLRVMNFRFQIGRSTS